MGILSPPGNHASRWIRDLWSKAVSQILSYFLTFLSFCVVCDFFRFKKIGFLGILGPPSYGIGANIRIDREMLGLQYAGFLHNVHNLAFVMCQVSCVVCDLSFVLFFSQIGGASRGG